VAAKTEWHIVVFLVPPELYGRPTRGSHHRNRFNITQVAASEGYAWSVLTDGTRTKIYETLMSKSGY
jgi:hypothetical protein